MTPGTNLKARKGFQNASLAQKENVNLEIVYMRRIAGLKRSSPPWPTNLSPSLSTFIVELWVLSACVMSCSCRPSKVSVLTFGKPEQFGLTAL